MNLSKQILLYVLFALSLTNTGCESIFLNEQSTDGTQWIKHSSAAEQCIPYEFETIEDALNKVTDLRGVTYTWNAGSRTGKSDMGVIAQEVESIIPEIVHDKKMALVDGETYKTVDYEKLTALLIEAVKELKAEVDALKASK